MARQDALHGVTKNLPRLGAPHVVGDQKAAAHQVFAQALDFGVAQAPRSGLRGVDPGVIEDALVVEEGKVLGLADINAREAPYASREVIVGFRPVYQPPAVAAAGAGSVSKAAVELRQIVVLKAYEMEFRVGRRVGHVRKRLGPPELRPKQRANDRQKERCK